MLSCDDEVLREVFYFIDPPLSKVVRVPQMFMASLRHQLGHLLATSLHRGIPILSWAHRVYAEIVRDKYLLRYDHTWSV